MNKYNIENGLDFFNELYKSLDIEEDQHKTDDDNNLCLITSQPLIEKFVEMICGHRFNYIPLYQDIKNHKQKFNNMEGCQSRLNHNEIRCPYCRKKQTGVLPYYENLKLPKINGVNVIDPNYKAPILSQGTYKYCDFLTPNTSYDPSGNNNVETSENNKGNCKFIKCFSMGYQIKHTYPDMVEIEDDKYYCYIHKRQVIKKYKKDKADKQKEEIKLAKLKAKEEEKQKKKDEKQKIKDELNKDVKAHKSSKKAHTKSDTENTVIGLIDIQENNTNTNNVCQAILKNGPNKGKHCGHKILNDNFCKRHYNLHK